MNNVLFLINRIIKKDQTNNQKNLSCELSFIWVQVKPWDDPVRLTGLRAYNYKPLINNIIIEYRCYTVQQFVYDLMQTCLLYTNMHKRT